LHWEQFQSQVRFRQELFGRKSLSTQIRKPSGSKGNLSTGRVISALAILFLAFDGVARVMRIAPVLKAFEQLG
jgi:hypothetical protein